MEKKVNKTIDLDLVGVNGNAYAIMGAFRKQAKKEGWSLEEIESVITEAKSKDYDHLMAVIISYCDPKEE